MKRNETIIGSLAIIILSLILVFISYKLRLDDRMHLAYGLWLENPLSILLNMIPIIIVATLLLGLTGRLDLSIILTLIIAVTIIFINVQKISIREEPLVLADLFVLREAINMVNNFDFGIEELLFKIGGLVVFFSTLIFLIFRKYKVNKNNRLLLVVSSILMSVILTNTVYSSEKIYNSLPRLQEYETNISQSYTDKGVFYALIYNRHAHRIHEPKEYRSNDLLEIKEDFKYKDPEIKPHVVMIMGEAWSDISKSEKISFKEGQDPFMYSDKVMEESIYHGHIICPTYGGGTANTEYDSLTGRSTKFHSEGVFTSYSAIRSPVKSITEVFNNNGYQSLAIHPGERWFYNRENVYDFLGFKDKYFKDDFDNPDYKGGFIAEYELTEFIIEKFQERYKDGPVFEFAVTIQNHSPFNTDKYGYDNDSFFAKDIDNENKSILESFFIGVRDMDYQIKALTEYFESINEPILLMYYGDHQPYLNEDYEAIKKLGYSIDPDNLSSMEIVYKTPFFLWGNSTYKKLMDPYSEELYISANYLAPTILDAATLVNTDYFYQYLLDLREEIPIMSAFFYYVDDGKGQYLKKYEELNDNELNKVIKYKNINYDLSKGIER